MFFDSYFQNASPLNIFQMVSPQAIIVSPLFFGVAHFHHMVERIKKGEPVLASFLISMFQVPILYNVRIFI